MSAPEALAIFGGGLAAGVVNAAVGSGTLITFPILLACGYSPVTANVSNTIGLVPGSLSGALAYRAHLRMEMGVVLRLGVPSVLGGIAGAVLLLALPPRAFEAIVPFLIGAAAVLVLLAPRIARATRQVTRARGLSLGLGVALFGSATYGGYFGAAQGVIVLAVLGLFLGREHQQVNGIKNVLVMLVNLVAAVAFVVGAPVAWLAALLIAVGSAFGGRLGALIAMRLPSHLFRAAILAVALVAIIRFV